MLYLFGQLCFLNCATENKSRIIRLKVMKNKTMGREKHPRSRVFHSNENWRNSIRVGLSRGDEGNAGE